MEEWTFGTYQVKSMIGRGGMGEVYRAFDTSHDRMVALKLLAAHLSQDESYRARFRRECHLAARLREPHVIPIHSYGETDGRLFLDMRLVEGRDLGDVLASGGALPPRRAVDIIGQVARALDAAHDDGLIHRDVKPSNVIIAEEDEGADSDFVFVYLVDFGVARAVGDDGNSNALTQTGGAVGTFDYMPPERFAGVVADRRTDVYSLTCMLYECLTGRRPFPGTDLPTLMYSHMNSVPPGPSRLNPQLTEAMDAVIARGMAKDPAARFATAGALASAARSALRSSSRRADDAPVTPAPPVRTDDRPSEVRTAWPHSDAGAAPTVGPAPFYQPQLGTSAERPLSQPTAGPYSPPSGPWPGPASRPPSGPVRGPAPGPMGPPASGAVPPGVLPPYLPPGLPASSPGPPSRGPGSGPGGGSGKRRSRLPLMVAAVVALALVATLAVVLVTRKHSSAGGPGPTTSAETGPSFGSISTSSSAAPPLDPALVKLLPNTYPQSRCSVGPVTDTLAAAALECGESTDTTNGPSVATFYRYRNLTTLRGDFQNVITNNKLAKATAQCPGVGYRSWHYENTPKLTAGQMASYLDSTGSATVSWTVEGSLELIVAQNFDKTRLPKMCKWWINA